ncbi:MAG: fatty acid desaturase family protein [Planctomycetota bacterium]|jgi:omega-6 fatty acid desaturase (delta-12 desaturase)
MSDESLSREQAKKLFELTSPFAQESLPMSWWYTGATFALLVVVLVSAGWVTPLPGRLALSLLGGLLLVRAFVLYHDFMHGAILRKSRLAKWLFYFYGLVSLTPPRSWRHSHNYHHANVGKPIPVKAGQFSLLISDIGAVPLMTVEMWQQASFGQRLRYKLSRHPLTIALAYATVFLYSICLYPLVTNPRKFWDGSVSILIHGLLIATVCMFAGFQAALFGVILPFTIAAGVGAYLFFAQHNFKGMVILPTETWDHFQAAIESSSYLAMGPVMNWFSANIGYHHIHHLNSKIPFYRLPEAYQAIPELRNAAKTTLRPRDIVDCFHRNLWDTHSGQLVSYREGLVIKSAQDDRKLKEDLVNLLRH